MGGLGSGRWSQHRKKKTVEDCLTLDIIGLVRGKLIRPGEYITGQLDWTRPVSQQPKSSCQYTANLSNGQWLRLWYDSGGQSLDYFVNIVSTRPFFGGTRWWLVCPLEVNGRSCGHRVGKLYLPPGANYFGCRHCHSLTYRSSQQSHCVSQLIFWDDSIPYDAWEHRCGDAGVR